MQNPEASLSVPLKKLKQKTPQGLERGAMAGHVSSHPTTPRGPLNLPGVPKPNQAPSKQAKRSVRHHPRAQWGDCSKEATVGKGLQDEGGGFRQAQGQTGHPSCVCTAQLTDTFKVKEAP